MQLHSMTAADWDDVRRIYEEGIATGQATLEVNIPTWEEWDAAHLRSCRWIAVEGDATAGWAALSPVSGRCVYGGVAEVSVYIASAFRGKGVGKTLLHELVRSSEQNGIWTLQAGILAENEASIRLHLACGFRSVGVREKLGQLNGVWKDIVLMERRSRVVGVEAAGRSKPQMETAR